MEIIGVLIAFFSIIIMVTRRINLGIVMLVGSIIIGLFSPAIKIGDFFNLLTAGVINQTTVEIVLVIINITFIASIMEKTGMVDQMISSLAVLFKKYEITLALIPSIMGALAIPGGAMLSAPMVNSMAQNLGLENSKKMAINLLFRHIWYFVFPFVPGLILTAGLMEVDVFFLIKHLFPFTLVMGGVGFFTLFKGINKTKDKTKATETAPPKVKLKALQEIILILLPLLIGIILPFFTRLTFWAALFIGLVILIVLKREQVNPGIVFKSIGWNLVLGILGIMVFREFVNHIDALPQLATNISNAGMPFWLLAIILPGMVGFITGSTSGAIGITFPLLLHLIGDIHVHMDYLVLMYGSAFFSYYVSPVHFCLILTADYFKVTLKETYKELFWPTAAGVMTMVILYLIY